MAILNLVISFGSFIIFVNAGDSNHDIHKENTLEMVHIIFRHGDRTPGGGYPTDPYVNETYYPYGREALTNDGKTTSYKLGKLLRATYSSFLSDVYTPSVSSTFSSPFSRCKETALAVLAGLFPPRRSIQRWDDYLDWQPIPYDYNPSSTDKIFISNANCPNAQALMAQNENYMMENGEFDGYEDVLQYLKENTGLTSLISQIPQILPYTLLPQEAWGLLLPAWTHSVWPEPIMKLAALGLKVRVGSDELKTVNAGYMMSQIIQHTYLKINGSSSNRDRKIELYSAQEWSVAAVLSWLGVFNPPHNVPYGAYISMEIHKIRGVHSIKMYYQNYTTTYPKAIRIPNCGTVCPLDEFVNLYEPYFNGEAFCY